MRRIWYSTNRYSLKMLDFPIGGIYEIKNSNSNYIINSDGSVHFGGAFSRTSDKGCGERQEFIPITRRTGIPGVNIQTPQETVKLYARLSWALLEEGVGVRLNVTDSGWWACGEEIAYQHGGISGASEVKRWIWIWKCI